MCVRVSVKSHLLKAMCNCEKKKEVEAYEEKMRGAHTWTLYSEQGQIYQM